MNGPIFPVVDLDELAEAAAIVVHNCLGVPKSLKNEKYARRDKYYKMLSLAPFT